MDDTRHVARGKDADSHRYAGSGLRRITPWGWGGDGSWSPDGTEIVFEHFGALFIVHPDGSSRSKISLQTRLRERLGRFFVTPESEGVCDD